MIQNLKLSPTGLDGMMNLDDAYVLCANVTREHSKSFYFSTRFLPAQIRRAIRAFYAFCRATDDMVDVAPAASATGMRLNEWRIQSGLPAHQQRNPILSAWADARDRYDVPQRYIEELIDGCEMDLRIHRYETFEDLSEYCYRVASTVGLVSMHIIGTITEHPIDRERAAHSAARLGIALQLTNILRDVGEDLARGRIYLPQEDMRRFHYTESDLRNGVVDGRFRALMAFEIERTRALYETDWDGIAYLRPEGRLAVGAAISLYQAILNCIIANRYDVFTKRAHLSTVTKISSIPGIYLRVRNLRAPCAE